VLYLGEINDGQREAWCQLIDAFDEGSRRHRQLALFPAARFRPAPKVMACRCGSRRWNCIGRAVARVFFGMSAV
jgi:hypothetical protein